MASLGNDGKERGRLRLMFGGSLLAAVVVIFLILAYRPFVNDGAICFAVSFLFIVGLVVSGLGMKDWM